MTEDANMKDREYAAKKEGRKPIRLNDGIDLEVTEEQKRVNLKAVARMRARGN